MWPFCFTAICEKDTLQWQETQRECERLLSEMDGGAGSKPDRQNKCVSVSCSDVAE